MEDQSGHAQHAPISLALRGVYGKVVQDGKSFFTNDPASHPDSIGTPPGHPPLKAFLGVPLIHAGRTIGMLGLDAGIIAGNEPARLRRAASCKGLRATTN